jgi:antitoxin ParD1/3/4
MLQRTTSFSLGDHFGAFVEKQVDQGRYASASDVVRAGLRLLEEQETHLAALQAALDEGLNSGTPQPFDIEEFLKERHAEIKNK